MADDSSVEEQQRKATEEILGKPIFDEFSENTLRIRRNLLLVSFVVVAYKLNGLSVGADISAFGLKLGGLTNRGVDLTLLSIVLYQLIHFFWNSLTHLQQWRLRITGTAVAHKTGAFWTDERGDYPDDPRQSTLYTWWSQQAKPFDNIGRDAKELLAKAATLEKQFKEFSNPAATANISSVVTSLSEIQKTALSLKSAVEEINKILSSNRIPTSLRRYDNWFKLFQRHQLMRWIVIEWLMPVVGGAAALLLLSLSLWADVKVMEKHSAPSSAQERSTL